MHDRSRLVNRLRSGLGAQGVKQAVNVFVRLAEVPLLLSFWGTARYGEWLMVAAIPAYLAMADGGFTGAAQREMTIRKGGDDQKGALAVFQSTWVLLLILSVGMMGLAAVITNTTPLASWLHFTSISNSELSAIVLLLTGQVVLGFQCGLIYGGYSCEGEYGRGTFIVAAMYLLDFLGMGAAIVMGAGPVGAAAGLAVGRAMGLVVFLIDLPRVAPWLRFGWSHASSARVMSLVRPSMASMAFPLGRALNIQGMRLVVGLVLGPSAVAVFSSIRTLCRSALKPVLIVAELVEPEMALAFGSGRLADMRDMLKRSSQVTLWMAVPACAVLWFIGAPLLNIWTTGRIELDVQLYALLLLASVAHSIWFSALMVSYATNRHGRAAVVFLAANLGLLVATAVLVDHIGIAGAGLAIALFEVVMVAWILPEAFMLSGERFVGWASLVARPPLFLVKSVMAKRT